jgi:alpha-beta hydrolase superfamily lysophospholipase
MEDLGPTDFVIDHIRVQRTDLVITNHFGNKLQCSHYEPHESSRSWNELPCVIYLHGNSSCRLEAIEAVNYLLPSNITLFCFDFAGCGMSEGEYISLGWHEREDLNLIVEHLRKERRCSTIGLWGRSMGAVTSLLHGDRDPSIAGMILDSPFSCMKDLVSELAKKYTKIPNFLVSAALKMVKSTIKSKANFDIYDLTPITHVGECFIPALFATATGDDFILPHHSEKLHAAYAGDKNLVKFEGDHNSPRPDFFFNSVVIFFYNTL